MAGVPAQPQTSASPYLVATTTSTTATKVCCCAIDFGTSSTGYAFRDRRQTRSQHIVMAEWGTQLHPKTPTEVVLAAAPPHALVEFGHHARRFMQNVDFEEAQNVLHFKGLKMLLYGSDKKTEVFSTNQPRVSVPLKHLVTCILSHLAQKALAQMRRDFPTEMDDVRWVITVPSIWDQSARAFMQECATGTGMKEVILALEPEAASLAVKAELNLPIGTKYILVDAGGGIVDIAVHECISETEIAELHRPTGGPWGSTLINELFFQLMGDVFGEDVVAKAQEDPGIFDLEDDVEKMKLTLSDTIPRQIISVSCIVSLLPQMSKPPFSQLVDIFNASHPGSPVISRNQGSRLIVDASLIKTNIGKLAAATSDHIRDNLLPSLSGVKVAYLVGGLSTCHHYRKVFRTQLTADGILEVVVPHQPSLAVLVGAVLYGESDRSVKKRCMPYTYAVGTTDLALRHPGRPTFQVDGQRWCNVLQVLVRSGEPLDSDEEISLVFSPISSDQNNITFDIFKSKSPTVKYPDDPGVELIKAGLQVNNLPGVGLPVQQRPRVTLQFKFASTIITVQAVCPGFLPVIAIWNEGDLKTKENTQPEVTLKGEVEKSTRHENDFSTVTSLISASASDFRANKLLGTGSNAAVFEVKYCSLDSSATMSLSPYCAMATSTEVKQYMVMKVLFNWENTLRQTMLRQKYMAECVILSLVPDHPNVIHPLGAFVIPRIPADFVNKIEQPVYRELCNNPSLAIPLPHVGITMSSFFSSLVNASNEKMAEVAQSLFVQGLKAIHHIESHSVVHRDIKADNILVDPESGKLTLIDFGEAQHCPNMEAMISSTTQPWGNPGTIPPELSSFLKRLTRGTSGMFSYAKCDSFALALTFWDTLLMPPSRKFIGNWNHGMSEFNTLSLLQEFPVPLFSASSSSLPPKENPATAARVVEISNTACLLKEVMIEMMNPDKAARLTAFSAILTLTPQTESTMTSGDRSS